MLTLKKICILLDIPYKVITINHNCKALLIDGKVMFEDYLFSTAFGRDLLHRAYLKQCGLDKDKYYHAMYNEVKN